tara:strand:+ start:7606 stop:8655 length:1050 start_codon:yes stop_codon:yes gene_type:complete
MARVFLHIGAHKTGTTFLQNLFHLNRERLQQVGVYYPHIGPNTAHHALAAAWIDLPDIPASFYGAAGPEGLWSRIIDRYAGATGTLFLSAENFSRCFPQEIDMKDLARRLSVFEEVRVIYTMRAQAPLVQSLWLQLARTNRVLAVHSYVREAIERRRAVGVRVDHDAMYAALLQGFAPEQIHLLDYSQLCRTPGGIGQAFLDLMGADVQAETLKQPQDAARNVSPDPLSYWIASQIAGSKIPAPELLIAVSEILRATGRPGTLLARYEYRKIRGRYSPGNADLVARVQPFQPGFSFEEPAFAENTLYRDEITQDLWIRFAAAIYAGQASAGGKNRSALLDWVRSSRRTS